MDGTCGKSCADSRSAAKTGRALTQNLFFRSKVPMYNDGRWAKQFPCTTFFTRLFVLSREGVLHGLRNVVKGHNKMEVKRQRRLTRSINICQQDGVPLSLLMSCFTGCVLEAVVMHLFEQHSADKAGSQKKKKDELLTLRDTRRGQS